MILEVKGGKSVGQSDVRGLRGALADSGALLAGLVVLHPLGQTKERNFKREMARAGRITIRGREFPQDAAYDRRGTVRSCLKTPFGPSQGSSKRLVH